jgi:hypothetical protein
LAFPEVEKIFTKYRLSLNSGTLDQGFTISGQVRKSGNGLEVTYVNRCWIL